MKEIAIWNPKGGSGKTTLAINLCACLSKHGYKTLLVDADMQKSALNVSQQGNLSFDVVDFDDASNHLKNTEYDIMVVDFAANQMKPKTKFILMPLRASFLDIRAVSEYINDNNIHVIMSAVDMRRADDKQLMMDLKCDYALRNRALFVRSLANGMSVFDDRIKDYHNRKEARNDVEKIYNMVVSEIL